jgi:hypothetical protein
LRHPRADPSKTSGGCQDPSRPGAIGFYPDTSLHRTGDDSPRKLDHGQSVPAARNLEDRVSSLEGSLSAFLLTMRELVQDVRCLTESLEVFGELDADVSGILKPSLRDLEGFFTRGLDLFLPPTHGEAVRPAR